MVRESSCVPEKYKGYSDDNYKDEVINDLQKKISNTNRNRNTIVEYLENQLEQDKLRTSSLDQSKNLDDLKHSMLKDYNLSDNEKKIIFNAIPRVKLCSETNFIVKTIEKLKIDSSYFELLDLKFMGCNRHGKRQFKYTYKVLNDNTTPVSSCIIP